MRDGAFHQERFVTAPYVSMPPEQRWGLALLYVVWAVVIAICIRCVAGMHAKALPPAWLDAIHQYPRLAAQTLHTLSRRSPARSVSAAKAGGRAEPFGARRARALVVRSRLPALEEAGRSNRLFVGYRKC
jgi:hypothetical protein